MNELTPPAAERTLLTPLWAITGPTASGKTALAIEVAKQLNIEIISLDSMALYRGMDVGTAKPTAAERSAVPHHLIDVIDPDEEFSVAQYLAAAQRAASEIQARSRVPLFVGGTPLYLKALLRGMFVGPAADWELRERLERFANERGQQALHERLAAVDPAAAERLHPCDTRRIIRAIEVHEKLGQPISQLQRQFDEPRRPDQCRVATLAWPREELYSRIDARVDAMFAAGLVAEVQTLLTRGGPLSRTAGQAVGYREVIEHLHGERELDATIALVKLRTRQFAKRQLTWFRSLAECQTVPLAAPLDVADTVRTIVAILTAK